MTSRDPVQVGYTPLFTRFLKHLTKKYRNVWRDLQSLIERLEAGETPGAQVRGTAYTVYKVRVRNSDISKGKSGGYRVIYYLKTTTSVLLLAIYSKTEQVDITPTKSAA
jgi:mRNA-degrading endonuclease RelE of RelBE toxin-antitoxin system